ncbi:hypothetical protein MtrunA17_Chr2g0285291 [Medicago truncatula]|uniref:Cullin-like protein, putative n=1 Tax=Medicago truncatula TaxID=3880 RepID=G7ILW8_MEDTR|nr:cullin-like protein, putative [Medicago truncatula]RHN72218.1 hypothetical protein MtrunA17_Chr2g0285291 [Medicago truncatula]
MVTEIGLFLHNFIRKVNEMHDKYLAQPTICAKYKIHNKEPSTKTISPIGYFEFISKFTDKMRMIKVQLSHTNCFDLFCISVFLVILVLM